MKRVLSAVLALGFLVGAVETAQAANYYITVSQGKTRSARIKYDHGRPYVQSYNRNIVRVWWDGRRVRFQGVRRGQAWVRVRARVRNINLGTGQRPVQTYRWHTDWVRVTVR